MPRCNASANNALCLTDDFVGGVTGEVAERPVDRQNTGLGIGDHDGFAAVLEYLGGQLQFQLRALALGDVAAAEHRAADLAGGIEQRIADGFQPQILAVRALVAEFRLPDRVPPSDSRQIATTRSRSSGWMPAKIEHPSTAKGS
jgi:hypothetical protein